MGAIALLKAWLKASKFLPLTIRKCTETPMKSFQALMDLDLTALDTKLLKNKI